MMQQLAQRTPVLTPYEANEFFMHRPSTARFHRNGDRDVVVVLDDTFNLQLDRRNNVVGQLALGIDPNLLIDQYINGQYFIVDGQIVDHRVGASTSKFVHDDSSIKELAGRLGFSTTKYGDIKAARATTNMDVDIPTAQEGGDFQVSLGFKWSPFDMDITSAIHMLRLICENGMTASAPVMSHSIPVMNQWAENLAISNEVIVHQFNRRVMPRLEAMPNERVSMHDVLSILTIINSLADSAQIDANQRDRLTNIKDLLEPLVTPDVMAIRKNMLAFIPAPVSSFDAMNILTEAVTHNLGSDRKGDRAIGLANHLLFDTGRSIKLDRDLSHLVTDTQTFHSPDRAFFGITSH